MAAAAPHPDEAALNTFSGTCPGLLRGSRKGGHRARPRIRRGSARTSCGGYLPLPESRGCSGRPAQLVERPLEVGGVPGLVCGGVAPVRHRPVWPALAPRSGPSAAASTPRRVTGLLEKRERTARQRVPALQAELLEAEAGWNGSVVPHRQEGLAPTFLAPDYQQVMNLSARGGRAHGAGWWRHVRCCSAWPADRRARPRRYRTSLGSCQAAVKGSSVRWRWRCRLLPCTSPGRKLSRAG